MTTTPTKLPLTLLVGLGLVGVLAGCSAPVETPAEEPTETETETDSGTETETDSGAAGSYADGDYSAAGEYQTPSGTESVEVSVTLEGDVITAVTVVGDASDAQAKGYQAQFASGIGSIVVGKNIDDIQVDKVGGSSLTSGGFNAAIDAIKADAAN
jgi:uncharacterized protein with FMN-binding domain